MISRIRTPASARPVSARPFAIARDAAPAFIADKADITSDAVAAQARVLGLTVVTANAREFTRVAELAVETRT